MFYRGRNQKREIVAALSSLLIDKIVENLSRVASPAYHGQATLSRWPLDRRIMHRCLHFDRRVMCDLSARQRLLHPGHGLDVTVKSLTSYRIPTVPRSDLRFFLPLKTRRIADSSAKSALDTKLPYQANGKRRSS